MSKQSKKITLHREQNSLCILCDEHLTLAEATLEHIVPVAHGGGDKVDNLAVSHAKCNSKRGTLPINVFKDFLAYKRECQSFHRTGMSIGRYLKHNGWEHNKEKMRWEQVDEKRQVAHTNDVRPVKQEPSSLEDVPSQAAKHLHTPRGVFASGFNSPCTCSKSRDFFCIGKGYCCENCWRDYEGMNSWNGHWQRVLK